MAVAVVTDDQGNATSVYAVVEQDCDQYVVTFYDAVLNNYFTCTDSVDTALYLAATPVLDAFMAQYKAAGSRNDWQRLTPLVRCGRRRCAGWAAAGRKDGAADIRRPAMGGQTAAAVRRAGHPIWPIGATVGSAGPGTIVIIPGDGTLGPVYLDSVPIPGNLSSPPQIPGPPNYPPGQGPTRPPTPSIPPQRPLP